MTRVDRSSVAGVRYLDLQRKARLTEMPTDELIQLYALECFLDRLTQSAFARNFVLKGGVLLAALDARRPTRDIDLVASALRNTEAEFLGVVREIARISLDDGIEFDSEQAIGLSACWVLRGCADALGRVAEEAEIRGENTNRVLYRIGLRHFSC
jgi:Nucleotidyl transferase AbiEii toxin, Type IV TA system